MESLLKVWAQAPELPLMLLVFIVAAKLWRKPDLRYLAVIFLTGGTISSSALAELFNPRMGYFALVDVVRNTSIFTGIGLAGMVYLGAVHSRQRWQTDLIAGLVLGVAAGVALAMRQ